jgi:hypothetical protein
MNSYSDIFMLCRDISTNKLGNHTACCDYYGTLDSVQVMVISRDKSWATDNPFYAKDLELSGDNFSQPELDACIKKLRRFL